MDTARGGWEAAGPASAQDPVDEAGPEIKEEHEDDDEDGPGLPVGDVPIEAPLHPPPQLHYVAHNIEAIYTEINHKIKHPNFI